MRAAHGSAVDRHQNKILAFATNSIEQASIELNNYRLTPVGS
jgi:hypothetical protein